MRHIRALSLILALSVLAGAGALAGIPTIRLISSRPAAMNDGRDFHELVAEVRDSTGSFVPDGTVVTFSTDLGQLAPGPVVSTRAGTARVRLTSIQKGVAKVTAMVPGGGIETIDNLIFTDDPADTVQGNAFVSVQATGSLLYSAGDRLVDATGRAGQPSDGRGLPGGRVVYRNVEIAANRLQLDCTGTAVRADGNVRLVRGSHRLACARLYYPLVAGDGYAIVEEGRSLRLVKVQGPDLKTAPAPGGVSPKMFEMVDVGDAPLVIAARHIILFPGEKLQFKRPRFYQQGQQVLSLPYYVLGLFSTQLFTDQFVSVGTQGLGVDVPLYYDLTPVSTGIFRIRHGERSGRSFYATRPGWSLDMTQAYNSLGTANRMSGELGFTGVNRGDWGFRWTHSQEFAGTTRGSFFLDMPQHRAVYTSANLNRQLGLMQLGLNLSANRSLSGFSTSGSEADVYLETLPRKVGRTGYMMAVGGNATTARTVAGDYRSNLATQGVQARFFSSPFRLTRDTVLTNYISVGNQWTNMGASGASVLGSLSATQTFRKGANLQVSYEFTHQPVMLPGTGQHRLSANFLASAGTKWNLYLYGSKLLDVPGDSLMTDFSYAVAPRWHLAVSGTLQHFAASSFGDLQLGIGRTIGGRDIFVSYSSFSHRFYFDMQASRF